MRYLVIGLGNIGPEYAGTRHNIGFDVVDHLAAEREVVFTSARLADTAEFRYRGKTVQLIKPTTYMNRSGRAVRYWMDQHKLGLEHVLVVVDDLALPLGKLRMRLKGSDAGHNGLADIQQQLGTNAYPRLRFGIGDDFPRGGQVDFVLGAWTDDERPVVRDRIPVAAEAVLRFIGQRPSQAMEWANGQ
jgi:PTH1 family peptidyl-tRNA hydrolase